MIRSDYLDALPLGILRVGEQMKFNHSDCPAGVDTRHRLYVIRKETGLWLAYCHNCGNSGIFTDSVSNEAVDKVLKNLVKHYVSGGSPILEDEMVLSTSKNSLPDDTTQTVAVWDSWVHSRLWRFHTTANEVTLPPYGWSYSPSLNQLITPIHNDNSPAIALAGFQARLAPGQKPKCITTYFPEHKGEPLLYFGGDPRIFIVEDPLSALRLHCDIGSSAMALLGTHLNDVAFATLLRVIERNGLEEVVVWMDGDLAGREASAKIFSRIRGIYNKTLQVKVVNSLAEAKTFTAEALRGLKI